ncbi:MAG TPA: WG repeat-containing protein, partial [Cyclobacteriaceae bacterium]
LRIEIPLAEHRLYPESFGARCVTDKGTSIFAGTHQSPVFDNVRVQAGRIAVSRAGKWHLYDYRTDSCSTAYDSISFTGVFAAGHRGDTVRIFFDGGNFRDFVNTPLRFVSGRDGGAYLQAGTGRLSFYDRNANLVFEGTYDGVQHAGGNYFIVSRKEKKGVVTADGKPLLPVAYDAIGDVDGNRIPLLRNMNFGMYSIATGKEIRPSYEKNIIPYNSELLVAWRKGKSGIIDFNNSVRIPFKYDGFRFWNDSAAWARDGGVWKIIDVNKGAVQVDNIQEFRIISESDKEIIVIVRRDAHFGILSSTRGVVIPIEYTEIENVGTTESPLFLAEKHVREADLSVVIYYDADGNAVRHQALEPEEYDQLSCD